MLMLGRKPVSPGYFPFKTRDYATNCILDIPQNIKLELSNNTIVLKFGSILTMTGSTYATVTLTNDVSKTLSNNGKFMLFPWVDLSDIGSAYVSNLYSGDENSYPVSPNFGSIYFNTTDKKIYRYTTSWIVWHVTYPCCIVEVVDGVASFAKDSNGNDMIFNGAGFIGHHAFVYPGVKVLIPNGFYEDDNYKNIEATTNSLLITELNTSRVNGVIAENNNGLIAKHTGYIEANELSQSSWIMQYLKNENKIYIWDSSIQSYQIVYKTVIITYSIDSNNIVTDFTISPVKEIRKIVYVTKLIENNS